MKAYSYTTDTEVQWFIEMHAAGMSFRAIAIKVGRDPRTVTLGVRRGYGALGSRKGIPQVHAKKLPESAIKRLLHLYATDETITAAAIGDRFGVSERAVYRYAKTFGVKPSYGVTFYRVRRGLRYERLS